MVLKLEIIWLFKFICFNQIIINAVHVPGPGPGFSNVTSSLHVQHSHVVPQYGNNMLNRRRSSTDGDGAISQMQSRSVDTRVQLEVLEGLPRGTVVGYIPTKSGFTYRFNEPPREFVLDQNSGEIKTNIVLDREDMQDRYDLVVLSSQPTYPIEVRITVLDINDNPPEFPEPSIAVSFSESAAPETRLLLDAATDRDIGNNGVTDDYRIVDGNHDEKFRLAVSTNPSGDVSYLQLETTGKLDRESRSFYQLNISARDGGNLYGYLQVNVTILDVNDNPPIFDHSDYIVSLNESVQPGTPVLQVMASDNDLGDNSKITYYLSDTETQFTVDPETGVISTTQRLNCQNCQPYPKKEGSCTKSCVFTVFARDHGQPKQDGRTYVTVNLLDTNDHDPIIRFQFFPPTGNFATVDENAVNGSVVAAVSVEDRDEGLNGQTNIQIISGNEMQHFRLEKNPSFEIVRVNGVLDREEISKYNLTVIATDKGSPPRTSTAYLIIHVNDVNDHEPVFEKSEYSAILSELSPLGTYVASITATDEDTGVNAQIYYDFVSGNGQHWFRIDHHSGLITTQAILDREVQGTVVMNISAHDGGPNPKWAYCQLKVNILDENDEAPKFSQSSINITLTENSPPHTVVAMLTATDHDQGTNGSVTYSLSPLVKQKYFDMFAIDMLTGQLITKTKLDREKNAFYEIFVIAKDQGTPQQSATATVFLNVGDINDNNPEFYPKHYFVSLSDDSVAGTKLIRVSATDKDEGENAVIFYHLENDEDGQFALDSSTGFVSLRKNARHLQKNSYRLIVSAKDKGDRKAEKNAVVEVIRKSQTDDLEFDSLFGYDFKIVEDAEQEPTVVGRDVGKVQIKPYSSSKLGGGFAGSSTVEYSITFGDPNENFEINKYSGVITTTKPIDREQIVNYRLTVVARVGGVFAQTNVNISVGDLNDNAPIFEQHFDEILLPENTAVGQEIFVCKASDRDFEINSRITYSIIYNPNDQFKISGQSGVIYLNRPIQSEPGTILHVELQAADGGSPSRSSKTTLTLTITDVNDHTPVFDHTSYETSLLEGTSVNTRFFALSASDADLGRNGKIDYFIVDGNHEGKFGIFPDGYLYLKSQLDREEKDYYSLTVVCKDHGSPSRLSTVPLIIHVIDENDNAPRFSNTTFVYSIAENQPADSFVGKLTAHDDDIGRNAELTYFLSVNEMDFTIDTRNGFIRTLHTFDREELVKRSGHNYLEFEAVVSDNGNTRLIDKVKVKVFITDVNDNAPKFVREPYKVQISEGSNVGSPVLHVFTVDVDEGLNGDVYYSIESGNEDGKFSLDSATGQISIASKLDRETRSLYKLIIMAQDASLEKQLTSTAMVTIEVLDENDVAPEFSQTDTEIFVKETTAIGTELMRFRATDSDLGINSKVTFSISAGNRKDTFHIERITGSLYLHKSLDFEDTQAYSLNVTASDGGNPKLSSTIIFVVHVLDENDNPPNFPNTAIVRQIREGIPIRTPIVTITAEDPDSGLNGKVSYYISKQEPEDSRRHFDINSTTGVIFTLKKIDRETIDTFRLTVVAVDQAENVRKRLSAEKIVTVIVEDVNDNAPIFVSMNAAILPTAMAGHSTKMQSSAAGFAHSQQHSNVIMYVKAKDLDSSTNGLVTYEMVSGNSDLFKLNRNTGAITLHKPIDKPDIRYQLAIKATDEAVQSERKSSDAYITLIVPNRSVSGAKSAPVTPVFVQNEQSGTVLENEPAGTSILTVTARIQSSSSSSSSDDAIEYYITNVTSSNGNKQVDRLFEIDTKLGILSTANELDRECGIDSYMIEVYAVAIGDEPRIASTKVKVTVMDKNDSPPVFRDTPLIFNVSEDSGVGQSVATIRAYDPDIKGTLTYTMIDGDDGKFVLEPDTGKLILRDALDREVKDNYKMKIRVADGIQSTETTVNVQVTDTNDNPPTFSEAVYSFDVPENAARGYQVGKVVATDRDLGDNGVITYTVVSEWANDVFSLHPQTGIFTLTARLDYEEVQHYILIVQAQDNGHPSLSTTITVYCNTVDLNDNAPIFDPMSYSNDIYENVPIGTTVVTVSATDIDSGYNGKIEYSIIAGDDKDEFEIDQSGTIRTKRELDRETKSSYNMIVAAKDCPIDVEERLSSTVQVSVSIKDVNDESPMFISSNETAVMENTPINTIIMAIKAVDHDEGRNGYIEYQLINPEPGLPFTLGSVDGLLRVLGHLDREIKSEYVINVRAKDRGEPPRSSQTQVKLKVLDENDNSPVFDPKLYSASVAENASIGAMVLQVSATDIDEDTNGRVRFMISSGDENRDFSISEDSGVIRVAKNLNYERKARYTLQIRAEDCATEAYENDLTDWNKSIGKGSGGNGASSNKIGSGKIGSKRNDNNKIGVKQSSDSNGNGNDKVDGGGNVIRRYDNAELTIVITDINDNPPTFLDSPYLAHVMENIIPPNDGYVITVKAFDADTPPFNNQVRYFLKEGDADLFRINSSSGEIYLQRALDREAQAEHILTIVGMDTGSPPLTGTGIVRIIVQDMNDHSPEFERQSYYVTVEENSPKNYRVLQPMATDKDAGLNSKLKFSLEGEKIDRFRIDANTGEIFTATVLDREETAVYHMTLIAEDSSATESRATAANVTIEVGDVNDNAPKFSKNKFEINLPDRIRANEFVFGAEATDIDANDNSKITYSISGRDASRFTINKLNGAIKTNTQLSSDTMGFNFNLLMHAEDQGIERKTATAELTLLLQPANLFPRFSYISNTQFVVSEDVVEGRTITKVTATSPKTGSASNIKYSFAGGNVGNALKIDSTSGIVSVGKHGLDYEDMHQYEIWVQAADSDEPSLRSVMMLLVNVTDTNDNAPVMEKMIYNTEVLEEEIPPQFIIKIQATDKDSGVNSELTYRLVNDYEGIFEMDADTGEIFTTTKLDREEIEAYELEVEAVDQGMPQLVGRAIVAVKVLDKNDNPPRFTRLFSVNVTENAEIGNFVIRVTSSDLDAGANANVSYTFAQNPGNKFSLDPISGNVTVAGNLDREIQDEYILKVAASDGAWRSETPITITIQDQNDNAPEFEHSFYSFSFPELQSSSSFVGQVIATDRDKQGPNSVISYSFKQPSDFFVIDPATGEIFTKRSIQFKHSQIKSSPENTYSLTVLATDNGKPPMYSECLINLNVVDANNNQPKFVKTNYLYPVPENAKVGQRISRIEAKDDLDYGVNAEIDYMITGGDAAQWFAINKHDGWISVTRNIIATDGSVYLLNVRATDHGVPPKHDDTSVKLIVTGENLFTPQFTALSYQVIVPENEPINSTILTVSASDQDDGMNGMIRYSILSGNEKKEFAINSETGSVTIAQPLDYDTVQEYHLNITAEDLGFKPKVAVAMLTVILTDVNDNAPQFNASEYDAYIEENKPRNTFVFKAEASDKDSPKNAVILYSITGGTGRDVFSIDSKTGVITSLVSFDYEEQRQYSVQVRAVNPDSSMSNSTKVSIHIVGVNEFFPRFVQPVFHFDVSESADIGTFVGTIQAVDKDSGEDGKVYYLLVGSSNDKGFTINPISGKITVSRILDRETQSRVVLTVMAKNQGGIRGNDTDEAQVIISIQDGNDPPEFTQQVYAAKVSESVAVGTHIVQVKAVDKDIRPQNNQFSYSIINGNANQAFKIEPQTGEIATANQLDREQAETFTLIIGAIDTGIPPQTGTATVKVQIEDVNDNGPTFEPHQLQGYISENEPAGTSIMTLQATDPDLPPNGGPFTYYLIGGKHSTLVSVDKYTGLVRTLQSIDRENTPKLEFKVEVEDNGTPRMRSQHKVEVNVLDQNDNPSSPRSVRVIVMILNKEVPNTKIADIRPNDPDTVGDYKCRLNSNNGSPNFHNFFTIPNKCELHTTSKVNPDLTYTYSILGNDGKHNDVSSSVSIDFSSFTNDTITNSVTIRIRNSTAEYFLSTHYLNFVELTKSFLEYGDSVVLYNVRNVKNSTDVEIYLAIKTAGPNYRSKSYVIERLTNKQDSLVKLLQLQTENFIVGYTPCSDRILNSCNNQGVCTEQIRYYDDLSTEYNIVDSRKLIFSAPPFAHDFVCKCPDGYVGHQCEQKQDPCAPNPCQAGAECRKQGREFQCICPFNREGRYCQLEKGDLCKLSPCRNGGSCQSSPDGISYFCLCRPGYRGNNCEYLTDSCRPNPCMHDGLCVNLKPGYKCNCIDGRYGRHCEKTTFGFQELSFMSFPTLDSATNDISIVFATTKQDALLLYNFGQQSGGRSDFIALQLVKGKATFSLGGSRTAITSVSIGDDNRRSDWSKNLADGSWHKITATRNGKLISLSVAKCTENGDACQECKPGDVQCYVDDIGPTGTLNFNKEPLLIGGLVTADPVLERPGQIHSDDLVGCVHSVSINGRTLNLSNPIQSRGILPTCNRKNSGGPCAQSLPNDPAQSVCGSYGTCIDRWNSALCRCGGTLLSPDCFSSLEPISLSDGGFLEFKISEKHRRMRLLDNLYHSNNIWSYDVEVTQRNRRFTSDNTNITALSQLYDPPKSMSLLFKTVRSKGLLFFAATNKYFTSVEIRKGKLFYNSKQTTAVNMTVNEPETVSDGKWHNVTLFVENRVLRILIDDVEVGEELDSSGVHDFLDPYLTMLSIGGVRREYANAENSIIPTFQGCLANFTINNEIQPFNGSGSVFYERLTRGSVFQGCLDIAGVDAAQVSDPLSIGITLVIVFFIILLVAILVSFVVFRVRKQQKEKCGGPGGGHVLQAKTNHSAHITNGIMSSGVDCVITRNLHSGDVNVGYHVENGDIIRRGGDNHHLVGPELLSKKFKERDLSSNELQRSQRPDIIEREGVGKNPPIREELHQPIPPPSQQLHPRDLQNGNVDLNSEYPEHYDLENASSIAPSDIDIVYHYKGYREGGGVRKYKTTTPPIASFAHHKHQSSVGQQQHRHSPHHAAPFAPRIPPQSNKSASNTPRQHQSTPLARLSPSSELSSQQPRILTLHDISGKPLQTALLATTSSSGGVGKDALHSNSERSLNSPVMSQLSGQSSSASRKNPSVPTVNSQEGIGLTADEIDRLNARPRTSSLVSTLDAVSSSSEAPRVPNAGHHLSLSVHHSTVDVDEHSSTSTDESGNDSFTCSEIEYDNNSLNGNKYSKGSADEERRQINSTNGSNKTPIPQAPASSYGGFDSSFRGSLSTLVASDDDISTHMGRIYNRKPSNGAPSSSATTLGWDYLLNWGPNYESIVGVFKGQLPDSVVDEHLATSLRSAPNNVSQKPSEEYV